MCQIGQACAVHAKNSKRKLSHVFRRSLVHIYEVRPRHDHRGLDLISDALPFGRCGTPKSRMQSSTQKFRSRSDQAVIRVCDESGNLIETHEHKGEVKEP